MNDARKTRLKKALMWIVCRQMWLGKIVTWAMKKFDLKGL